MMIGKFLSSRFSGYIAIVGVIAILGLVYYIYSEGKEACRNDVANEQIEQNAEINQISSETKLQEQSLSLSDIDVELCNLRIMREQHGCQ